MEDTTDIENAQADDPEALRDALLDQLGYLTDEVAALRSVVGDLPDEIKSGRPGPDTLTMKELYGAIATLDTRVRPSRAERIVETDDPAFASVDIKAEVQDNGWNERDIHDILDEVIDARQALVDQLSSFSVEDWHRTGTLDGDALTLFELVHRFTQTDAERLRDLGYRLHGAHLSDRDEPLPS